MYNVSWFEQRTTFALQIDIDWSEQCNVHFLYVIMEYDIYFGICLCSILTCLLNLQIPAKIIKKTHFKLTLADGL